MKKHAIITSSNNKHGDFLINHWLHSLQKNVKLNAIDIIVIEYGLTEKQKKILKSNNVVIYSGTHKGHIVTSRFMDTLKLLEKSKYDQILFCDGGDIIFQKDISPLFEQNKNVYRAVPQDIEGFYDFFFQNSFTKSAEKKIYEYLRDKPVFNAGFILAPRKKFIVLCNNIEKLLKNKTNYGPDQVVVNYTLYKGKVIPLDRKYNFMINTSNEGFTLKDGKFHFIDGKLITVVHNAGRVHLFRPMINFGFGKGFNYTNYITYYVKKTLYAVVTFFIRIIPRYIMKKETSL